MAKPTDATVGMVDHVVAILALADRLGVTIEDAATLYVRVVKAFANASEQLQKAH